MRLCGSAPIQGFADVACFASGPNPADKLLDERLWKVVFVIAANAKSYVIRAVVKKSSWNLWAIAAPIYKIVTDQHPIRTSVSSDI